MTLPAEEPTGLIREEPLSRHTSLKIGGPAEFFVVASSAPGVVAALAWASQRAMPVRVLGGGSNLLVADSGVEGLVVKIAGGSDRIEGSAGSSALVVAAAGIGLANLARRVSRAGYSGLEWASNVPGTVGGAVVNNAGAFGGDMARSLATVHIVDSAANRSELGISDLRYGYRTSVFKRGELGAVAVVEASLRVELADPAETRLRVAAHQAQRTRTQPRQLSAGSIFANPLPDSSGRLIEQAGLKGHRIGGAVVSQLHANFVVNVGGASAADVFALMRLIQDTVFRTASLWLKPEIELCGRWSVAERLSLQGPAGSGQFHQAQEAAAL